MRGCSKPALLMVVIIMGCGGKSANAPITPPIMGVAFNSPTFHGDAQRLGSNSTETQLTPATVSGGNFGPLWNSPQFDSLNLAGTVFPPHLYATPLYIDDLLLTGGKFSGLHLSVICAATSNGWVYAVNATDRNSVAAGTVLWATQLGLAAVVPKLDGGVPLGILSTPVIDLNATPPRLYAASDVSDASGRNWKVFALDLGSGSVLSGWPVTINDAALAPVNQNGPATFQNTEEMSQRGALNLSPDGRLLYVPFASYGDVSAGFLVAVDTQQSVIASAFSSAPSSLGAASGGVWGSGGPAIDFQGHVFETTGNSPDGSANAAGVWGDSALAFDAISPLRLIGTYSPWDYCQMDSTDIDLGGSSPIVLPDLDPSTTLTPHLIAFGSKQGVVYLLNRDKLPGRLDRRPLCNTTDSSQDSSLLPNAPQPPFGTAGPLVVFGPFSENCDSSDLAKMRTTPAYFESQNGNRYIFVSGAQKLAQCDRTPIPPGLVRLKLVTIPNQPASLSIDAADSVLNLFSPGPPIVSSNNGSNGIVWILDANIYRSVPLVGTVPAHPVLYAMDASSMQLLWQSKPEQLHIGGKYNHVVVAHGVVFVGTDSIQAFGLH